MTNLIYEGYVQQAAALHVNKHPDAPIWRTWPNAMHVWEAGGRNELGMKELRSTFPMAFVH